MGGTTKRWCVYCTGELRRNHELPERRCRHPGVVARREAEHDQQFGGLGWWCPSCPECYEECARLGYETPVLCDDGKEPESY